MDKEKNKGISAGVLRMIAIVVVLLLSYQGVKLLKVSKNLDRQIQETQKEIAIESKKLEELKNEYENIESLQTVENIAREKLGMVKDDEIVFREKY